MTETQDVDTQLDLLLDRLSLEQKIDLLTGVGPWSMGAQPDIGLREMMASDGPAGVRGVSWDERDTALSLPSASALGAGWNPALVRRLGTELAREAQAKGVDIVLAPTVNLHRSPLGGRHFEAFSEDPLLSGEIGAAMVNGIQSEGIAAAAKHFVCNDSETDRMTIDIHVSQRALREIYLVPFESLVVDAKVWLIMSAYNSVNGVTMSEHPMLSSPLKDEWGFDGVVISDWAAVRSTEESALSGQDLVMPGPDSAWGQALVVAVQEGRVPEEVIDDKARRVLRLAARVGALDGLRLAVAQCEVTTEPGTSEHGVPETAMQPHEGLSQGAYLSYLAAVDGMVLVRNTTPDGSSAPLLPVSAGLVSQVAVIGQSAEVARSQGGGSAMVFSKKNISPLEGLQAVFGSDRVSYSLGTSAVRGFEPFQVNEVTDPVTGGAGIRLRYLGDNDVVLNDEVRLSGQFLWMRDPLIGKTKIVELSTRYRAPSSGEYGFGVAGLGDFEISFDGKVVTEERVAFDSVDPVTGMLNPPQRICKKTLVAGQVLDLRVRYRVETLQILNTFAISCGVEKPHAGDDEELAKAVHLAAESDLAVVVVGTSATEESEGFDRETLRLPGRQDDLIRAVAAVNPHTVVVVNSGGPVLMPWLDDVAATILMWFPGQEGGRALADVLVGQVEPGGRMPTTWANSEDDVPVWQVEPISGVLHYGDDIHCGYREWARRAELGGPQPALVFGYGLGYTSWQLVAAKEIEHNPGPCCKDGQDCQPVEVRVRNTGDRSGKVVVQAYLSKPDSQVERPVRWLGAFQSEQVEAGKETSLTLNITSRALRYWSTEQSLWIYEPGEYFVHIGLHVADSALTIAMKR